MPAGFNKGQVEYIKAIANVNGHKTYKDVAFNRNQTAATHTNDLTSVTYDNLTKYRLWCLGQAPLVRDTAGAIGALAAVTNLNVFNIPMATQTVAGVEVNEAAAPASEREGPEGFLESTHLRLRVVLPHQNNSFADDHCECRLIVFRARDRQHHNTQHMKDFSNPYYNLFHGNANYNCGFSGYERKEDIQGDVTYVANTDPNASGYINVGHQDALTLPINKESYVVMKDHRFFLGKEYGGKNIYETTLHWDWNDPVSTTSDDVTDTDNDKNYCWYILLMANNNNFITTDQAYLCVRMTGTTHMTSG